METITHGMVYLDGERQQHFFPLFIVFSKGEHRGKKILHVRNVDIKTGKTYPGLAETKNIFSRDSSLGR
jgi:hypothetical protein